MFRRRLAQRAVPLPPYDAPTGRDGLRLASLERDFWQLRDGEQSAREHPETFDVPARELCDNLQRLDLVSPDSSTATSPATPHPAHVL